MGLQLDANLTAQTRTRFVFVHAPTHVEVLRTTYKVATNSGCWRRCVKLAATSTLASTRTSVPSNWTNSCKECSSVREEHRRLEPVSGKPIPVAQGSLPVDTRRRLFHPGGGADRAQRSSASHEALDHIAYCGQIKVKARRSQDQAGFAPARKLRHRGINGPGHLEGRTWRS